MSRPSGPNANGDGAGEQPSAGTEPEPGRGWRAGPPVYDVTQLLPLIRELDPSVRAVVVLVALGLSAFGLVAWCSPEGEFLWGPFVLLVGLIAFAVFFARPTAVVETTAHVPVESRVGVPIERPMPSAARRVPESYVWGQYSLSLILTTVSEESLRGAIANVAIAHAMPDQDASDKCKLTGLKAMLETALREKYPERQE